MTGKPSAVRNTGLRSEARTPKPEMIKMTSGSPTAPRRPYLRALFLGKSSFIPRLPGIFFLLLFTLSVTPKRFLHDVLANHRDTERVVSGDRQEMASSGFQCHADDLVVEAPFLPGTGNLFSLDIPSFIFGYASPLYLRIARTVLVSAVRGPPVAAVS